MWVGSCIAFSANRAVRIKLMMMMMMMMMSAVRAAGGSFPFTLGRIAHGYDVRPDLCAVSCSRNPRSFAGEFYVDSLVHDATALRLLLDVIGQAGLRTFPGKTFPGKSENHFPRKIVCHCFNVKQTLTVFCVNYRIILLTGLLSLIREVMQRGPALLIFTQSALSGQVPAHHVGPICSQRV